MHSCHQLQVNRSYYEDRNFLLKAKLYLRWAHYNAVLLQWLNPDNTLQYKRQLLAEFLLWCHFAGVQGKS